MGDASGNERQIEHRFGIRLIDRIPLLRELPGFRTRTLWKELLAGLCYLSTIRFIILLRDSETLIALMIVIPTYILVPLQYGQLSALFSKTHENGHISIFNDTYPDYSNGIILSDSSIGTIF